MKGKPVFSTRSSQVLFSISLLKNEFDLGSFWGSCVSGHCLCFLGAVRLIHLYKIHFFKRLLPFFKESLNSKNT